MSTHYSPWTWSDTYKKHYSHLLTSDGRVLDTIWSGPAANPAQETSEPRSEVLTNASNISIPPASAPQENDNKNVQGPRHDSFAAPPIGPSTIYATPGTGPSNVTTSWLPYTAVSQTKSSQPASASNSGPQSTSTPRLASLPPDVQAELGYLDRRFIQTGADGKDTETLDARYRRVAGNHQQFFFVPGRVFKMLWTEPAGQANPGRTRNSTHFSTVLFGEQVYSEIRRFIVVRNKGTFSQCIPIQTYRGRGATKPGIVIQDHGVVHTTLQAPNLFPGEYLTKYSIRVEPTGTEFLEAASRVNYGKAYAVEHNVKVLDIGMVVEGHRYLIEGYFNSAMIGR